MTRIAIIGAGAAGMFCAVNLKMRAPHLQVSVFESASKPLAKVAITGGGRCNLTNSFQGIKSLSAAYPRGEKLIKRLFNRFDYRDTYRWFEAQGVKLVTQADECVFPQSQDAMEIVNLLTHKAKLLGVDLFMNHRVAHVEAPTSPNDVFTISFTDAHKDVTAHTVVATTGGAPKQSGLAFLDGLGLEFVAPVPSLFSFNLPDNAIKQLMGTVMNDVTASIPGTKYKAQGPLLITHWGVSGPAILKLSSYAARTLAERNYESMVSINWLNDLNEQDATAMLQQQIAANPQKQLSSLHIGDIPNRLWLHLLERSSQEPTRKCAEIGKKGINKLVNALTNDTYSINGKSRFKEEFVTCGGVAIRNIDSNTLECKTCRGLYFAGEVLDIDAITGGFNLQAAWTTGYVVAESIETRTHATE